MSQNSIEIKTQSGLIRIYKPVEIRVVWSVFVKLILKQFKVKTTQTVGPICLGVGDLCHECIFVLLMYAYNNLCILIHSFYNIFFHYSFIYVS